METAQRYHSSLLSRLERRLLVWIANRLPSRVQPDHLTLLGLAAMAAAGIGYYLTRFDLAFLHLVNFCLLANWFGDSLDGTLARTRNRQRPRYGFYVDHVIDSVGALFLLSGLGVSGLMSERVAVALLIAYLLLSIDSYLAAHALGRFRISYFKMSPTEVRILIAAGNLALLLRGSTRVMDERFLLFDIGGLGAAAGILGVFLVSTLRNTRELYQLERL